MVATVLAYVLMLSVFFSSNLTLPVIFMCLKVKFILYSYMFFSSLKEVSAPVPSEGSIAGRQGRRLAAEGHGH